MKMLLYDCVDQEKIPALPHGVFNIQNVADYINELAVEGDTINCIPVSCRLPFPESTWFEFQSRHVLHDGNPIKCGVLAFNEEEFQGKKQKLLALVIYRDLWGKAIEVGSSVIFCGDKWEPADVTQDARIGIYSSFSPDVNPNLSEEDKAWLSDTMNELNSVVLLALNFLHCKNVVPAENRLPRQLTRARKRKNKPYFERFHTLVIESTKKILNKEGRAHTKGLSYALHICRGHFRTYDGKGLFGKYKGTFWISPHVRGDRSIGRVDKNYVLRGRK